MRWMFLALVAALTAPIWLACGAEPNAGGESRPPGAASDKEPAAASPAELVRKTYDEYTEAILAADGERAVELVSKATIDYYQRMRDVAYSAPRSDVEALRVIDRITVFGIRHRMTPEMVEPMDGRAMFIHAVDQQWIGRQGVIDNSLGDISVKGDMATGVHVSGGTPTPLKHLFRKEDGRWRMDLTETMKNASASFDRLIQNSGMEPDELVFQLLTNVSGKQVGDDIWNPMAK